MTDHERELCSSPFVASNFAKAILVEQIMALIGRSSERPNDYRRTLYGFEIATLRRTLAELIGDFPDPSLTETAGVIASTDTGHAPGSARETFKSSTKGVPIMQTAGESPASTEALSPAGDETAPDHSASDSFPVTRHSPLPRHSPLATSPT
jgi:hypothetical protein